jgi:hypothetical protein
MIQVAIGSMYPIIKEKIIKNPKLPMPVRKAKDVQYAKQAMDVPQATNRPASVGKVSASVNSEISNA